MPASLLVLVVRALWRRRRYVSLPTAHLLPAAAYPAVHRPPPAAACSAWPGIAATAVALAEPVVPHSTEDLQSLGIDIMLVLDLSSSHERRDGRASASPDGPKGPTRLDRTRQRPAPFINSRHGDRLGMVVFSNYAYVVSPLTLDRDYLLRYLDIVDDQILRNEAMTAIGDGIDMGAFVLNKQSERHAAQQGDHRVHGWRAELRARSDGVAGRSRRRRISGCTWSAWISTSRSRSGRRCRRLISAVRRLWRPLLRGRHRDARAAHAPTTALDTLEKSLVVSQTHLANDPVYHWFALAAVALIGMALAAQRDSVLQRNDLTDRDQEGSGVRKVTGCCPDR